VPESAARSFADRHSAGCSSDAFDRGENKGNRAAHPQSALALARRRNPERQRATEANHNR
jgi:hypothetical protein